MHAVRFPPFATELYAPQRQQQTSTRGGAQLKFGSQANTKSCAVNVPVKPTRVTASAPAPAPAWITVLPPPWLITSWLNEVMCVRAIEYASELDDIMLALAEIMNEILGPDCLGSCVLENESVLAKGHFAAAGYIIATVYKDAVYLACITPHVISDAVDIICGPRNQRIIARVGGVRHLARSAEK